MEQILAGSHRVKLGTTELNMNDSNERIFAQFLANDTMGSLSVFANSNHLAKAFREHAAEGNPQKGIMYASLLMAKDKLKEGEGAEKLAAKAAEIYADNFPDNKRSPSSAAITNTADMGRDDIPKEVSVRDMMALAAEGLDGLEGFANSNTKNKSRAKTAEQHNQPAPSVQNRSMVGSFIRNTAQFAANLIGLFAGARASQSASSENMMGTSSRDVEVIDMDVPYDAKGVEEIYERLNQNPLSNDSLNTYALGNDKNRFLENRRNMVQAAIEDGNPQTIMRAKANAFRCYQSAAKADPSFKKDSDFVNQYTELASNFSPQMAQEALDQGYLTNVDARSLMHAHQSVRDAGGHVAGDSESTQQTQQDVSASEYTSDTNAYAAITMAQQSQRA